MRMPLPPPPAAGLISSGKPTARARSAKVVGIVVLDRRRRDRKAARRDKSAGPHLVAHQLDRFGCGADEDQARVRHLAGEVRILGQEAITRMDRAGAACARRGDDLRAVEIGCDRRRAGDLDRAIGGPNRRRRRIG